MNWIKSNPFVAALAGITLVVCGILFFIASRGAGKYDDAKIGFDEAYQKVSTAESISLYPKAEYRDAKRKALNEHREAINGLRGLFDAYRPAKLENISSQEFTDRLKSATEEVSKALEDAGCELPPGFFMGFEKYRDQLAQSGSTGVLAYQLEGVKNALLNLAEARPSELIKVYREPVAEESGGKFEPGQNDVTRNYGYEVVFKGSETSARKFITSLGKTDTFYYIVRTLKVQNERSTPPKVSDAAFEKDKPVAAASSAEANNPFGGAFALPTDPAEAAVEAETPAPAEEATVEETPADIADTSRILAQVLGSEEVIVFVRFDITQFLPSKELPKP